LRDLPALTVDQRELVGVAQGHRDQACLGVGRYPFRRGTDLDDPAGGLLLERRRLGRLRSRGRLSLCGVPSGTAAREHEQDRRERDQG
jgi:hypothetical protein